MKLLFDVEEFLEATIGVSRELKFDNQMNGRSDRNWTTELD